MKIRLSAILGLVLMVAVLSSKAAATTFVVMEGDAEVGRYEEPDGKEDVQIIQNEKPKPLSQPPKPASYLPEEMQDEAFLTPMDRIVNALKKDSDFVAYLHQQPWFQSLRSLDEQYAIAAKITAHKRLIISSAIGLLIAGILYRIYRFFRWLYRRKTPEGRDLTL